MTQHKLKVLHDLIFTREQHVVQVFPNSIKGWVGKSPHSRRLESKILLVENFFTRWREREEDWFLRFEPFSKLKTTFCEYWTSITIKINIACVSKEYKIKTKMEQGQWLQLKMMFLLGYNLKINV